MNDEKTIHIITSSRGGEGMDSWIQSTCSCGWWCKTWYAPDAWQMTNCREESDQHLLRKGALL